MRYLFASLLFCAFIQNSEAQVKNLYPVETELLNFSNEGEEGFTKGIHTTGLFDRIGILEESKIDTAADGTIDTVIVETFLPLYENYFDVLEPGCSWYCVGVVDTVKASSYLSTPEGFTYHAGNAHDFSYSTAWIEGAKGSGIGEYLEYQFGPESSTVDKIKIANGCVKSAKEWSENGRVKKLMLYVNGKAYAVLNLKNTRSEQVFKVGPFGYRNYYRLADPPLTPWRLRFVIMEVYPGTTFSNTAISEIHFMGDVEH